ncbi:phage tail assembly protein [Niameybacter massiliensis]|uniref:Phage tail assembly protein n=1 Tax=Holtiella tumoricola TaxID=3018743 RepID=A0AA42J0Z0_9FIRM|nr:phage tail assembly protein [Holtiella tumoricola]MDA3731671.1 phage tail assembly protein [Holtiella tumoricola]
MKMKLKKPINFEGELITELNLDLDCLTGKDMIDAQKEIQSLDVPVLEFNKEYLAVVAAKACGMPTDLIPLLGIKDFSTITVQVQNFLLGEESVTEPTLEE